MRQSFSEHSPFRKQPLFVALLLAALTLILFSPAFRYDFVNYDDDIYVYQNPHVLGGLTGAGLSYAFQTSDGGSWMPLTWISYMCDATFFGGHPSGFHLTNVLMHAASVGLLFLALSQMTKRFWPSVFIAAIFALHPLRVESVVWIAERKDTLSALFWMLGLLTYASYAQKPNLTRYISVFVCLLCGLMSKPMLVTFPFVLLLLDHWPLGRTGKNWSELKTNLWPLVREKIPLFVLCAVIAGVTLWTQHQEGAVMSLHAASQGKVLRVADNYSFYAEKIFWPTQFSILYAVKKIVVWRAILSALAIVALIWISLRWLFRLPWLATGWLWFLGTLVPVVGIIHVGHIMVADRYSYIPSIGLIMIAAFAMDNWIQLKPQIRLIAVPLALASIVACAAITQASLPHWENSLAVFSDAVAKGPHEVAYNNLAAAYQAKGDSAQSITAATKAIEMFPKYAEAYNNRGLAYHSANDFAAALHDFNRAIELKTNFAAAYNNRGATHLQLGETDLALADFNMAIKLKPDYATALSNRGSIEADLGNSEAAFNDDTEAIRYDPSLADAWSNRGNVLGQLGEFSQALINYDHAIFLKPDEAKYYNNRAAAYFNLKEYALAKADLEKCRVLGGQPHPGLIRDLEKAMNTKAQ